MEIEDIARAFLKAAPIAIASVAVLTLIGLLIKWMIT